MECFRRSRRSVPFYWILQKIVRGGKNLGLKSAICLAGVEGQIVSVICSKKNPDDRQESVIKFRGALHDLGGQHIRSVLGNYGNTVPSCKDRGDVPRRVRTRDLANSASAN